MAETELCSGAAAVYNYDAGTSSWKSVDGGISSVAIFHNPATGLYRVVALSPTAGAVINTAIYPDLTLKKLSDNFLSWPDATTVYGVNFADTSDAAAFIEALNNSVEACKAESSPSPAAKPSAKGGLIGELNNKLAKKPAAGTAATSPATKPAAVAAKPTAVAATAAAKPGATAASPKGANEPGNKGSLREGGGWAAARAPGSGSNRKDSQPTPAAATPTPAPAATKPAAKPGASTYARLMGSDSAESAPASKPAATQTASGRELVSPRKDQPPAASPSAASASSGPAIDYDALKNEMMSAFREELERARQEILDAVREVRGL